MTGTGQVFFDGFGGLTNTGALMNRRKLLNPPKITLHKNCHSTAPIRALNIIVMAIFSYKMNFMKKVLVVVLYHVEVQFQVL